MMNDHTGVCLQKDDIVLGGVAALLLALSLAFVCPNGLSFVLKRQVRGLKIYWAPRSVGGFRISKDQGEEGSYVMIGPVQDRRHNTERVLHLKVDTKVADLLERGDINWKCFGHVVILQKSLQSLIAGALFCCDAVVLDTLAPLIALPARNIGGYWPLHGYVVIGSRGGHS
jgi:hypothetical protein